MLKQIFSAKLLADWTSDTCHCRCRMRKNQLNGKHKYYISISSVQSQSVLKPSGRLLLFSGFCSSCAVFSRAETTFTFPGMMSLCLCLSLIYLFTVIPSCTLPVLRPYSDPAADFKSTEVSLPVQSFLPSPSVLVSSHVFFFFWQSDFYPCRVNYSNYYSYNKN